MDVVRRHGRPVSASRTVDGDGDRTDFLTSLETVKDAVMASEYIQLE